MREGMISQLRAERDHGNVEICISRCPNSLQGIQMITIPRWSAHDVRDWKHLCILNENGKRELNPVTCVLINYTLAIGVNEITEDNIDEVFCLVALLEAVYGAVLTTTKNTPLFITRDDVARHIGLRTESPPIALSDFWNQMLVINRNKNSVGMREANGGTTALQVCRGRTREPREAD